jgi:amidase
MLALGAYLIREQGGHQYHRAQNVCEVLSNEFDTELESVDVLASPATPTTALQRGEFERGVTSAPDVTTRPTNLTGHPSITVPCDGIDGLPVGLQIIGPWDEDKTVLDVAFEIEKRMSDPKSVDNTE